MTVDQIEVTRTVPTTATHQVNQARIDRRFCPSIFCFTGEIVVRRVSRKAPVWLLTDEREAHTWLMMGQEPVCPHCGTTLI
jgi:hypothetical protein